MQLSLALLAISFAFVSANPQQAVDRQVVKNGLGYTSTFTQRITCTKSTNAVCGGRRRQEIVTKFELKSTLSVFEVEDDEFSPTTVQGIEASQIRTGDSVLLGMPVEYNYQEIQSAIDNNVEYQNRQLVTFPIATFTAFLQVSLEFVTSTPACSAPGKFFQCPQL